MNNLTMESILILFVTSGIFFMRASAYWVTVDDFKPSELVNLTLQQEHELMLQKLATKEVSVLASAFYFEILSMNIGNYFFAFAQDETTARGNNAIVKATFECLKKLLIQDRADQLLLNVSTSGAAYAKTFGNVSFAFSLMCSDLDSLLANEIQYTTLRDKFKKKRYSLPNEVYHYGIAKSTKNEIDAVRELYNEPKMKLLLAHHTWVHIKDSQDSRSREIRQAVLKLAKVPDKLHEVQKLYERSIDEIVPQITHPSTKIDEPWTGHLYFSYLQPILSKNLWSKIIENIPDWSDYFECNLTGDDTTDSSSVQGKRGKSQRCGKVEVKPDLGWTSDNVWPITTDFDPIILLNLTLEQQHELFLQELAKKHLKLIEKLMYLELLAKSTGSDFFGFVKDKKTNAKNNAIARAVVKCISSLRLQTSIRDIIAHFTKTESEYVKKTGDIGEGFNRVCLKIDDILKDIDIYTLRRDTYIKENVSSPKRTYQYSIGDPIDDQRKIIGELYSDPQMIKYFLHNFWMGTNMPEPTPEETRTKFIIYELAKVNSQAETIQRIYEQSVDEVSPFVKGFRSDSIFKFVNTPQIETLTIELKDFFKIRSLITKRIVANVNQYPDLVTIFKAFNQQT